MEFCRNVLGGVLGFSGLRDDDVVTTTIKPSKTPKVTFEKLLKNSNKIYLVSSATSLTANKIAAVGATKELKAEIVENAKNTRPLVHERVVKLSESFLNFKRKLGSEKEKQLYAKMEARTFIERLLVKRPLVFMTERDEHVLRDGSKGVGGFDAIGTDNEQDPLTLQDYISYDEMAVSSLIGMSTPTHFINDGNRHNGGRVGKAGTFTEKGIYQALVGARFERSRKMEHKCIFITPEQNTVENGYGLDAVGTPKEALKPWEDFYGVDYFPSYKEAEADTSGRFVQTKEGYLDQKLYRARMKVTVETALVDADGRAKDVGKKAYVHAVGLGLGEWAVDVTTQGQILADLYYEVLKERNLSYISDIDFSWFPSEVTQCGGIKDGEQIEGKVTIHFSKRNPADPLPDPTNQLLIAQYPWDGNSAPGNEYWDALYNASGDPAAACCSTISELQNPLINKAATSNIFLIY